MPPHKRGDNINSGEIFEILPNTEEVTIKSLNKTEDVVAWFKNTFDEVNDIQHVYRSQIPTRSTRHCVRLLKPMRLF